MTSTHCFRVLLAAVIVLCVAGAAALFLLPPSQAGGEPIVSFETIPPEEMPEIVDAALFPGAVTGNVAIVWSPTDNAPRYYLVPLTRNGSAVAIARVSLQNDGTPGGVSWTEGVADLTAWRRPSLADAKEAFNKAGYRDGNWSAQWVELNAEQPIGPYFWEFRKETGETAYVGYDRYEDRIRVYDTVVLKTKGGG